ncbi:response regulator transcription factor [Nocardioides albus]|uniref:DNA-binding NarL/FixJ family response regulator n=1 Tax=Nocardioides albus TaxID=1841 RepID=A0A7W5A1Y4_9ACTN|nr:response regulator transcription factor [Nocardioides albus]MBB3087963.1 DNA-binding NarL/FixJ family response regulator [Nocardioides albus]GGU21618.1 putative two-component system response regulator LuxR [Nocardioides albus]
MTAVNGSAPIRVIVVDDQELVRSGLRRILRRRDGLEIVAECADGSEVVAALSAHPADVVVMDLRMRQVDGITATGLVRALPSAPPVLVLTTFDEDELVSGALRAGAAGFILKDSPAEELVMAVRSVALGDAWLDPAITGRVLATYRSAVAPSAAASAVEVSELTDRELEVLRGLASGWTNSEIAERLVISELTVKSHIGRIFAKLDLRDRAAAIVFAYDHGIVRPAT